MFNPFAEVADADSPDDELVAEAQHGNRVALEKQLRRRARELGYELHKIEPQAAPAVE